MDTITTILIIGIAANGIAFATLLLAGPVYAWSGDSPSGGGEQSKTEGLATIAGLTERTKQVQVKTGN